MTTSDSPSADGALAWAYAHCEGLVRDGDRDRYFATLFAPADKRPHLFAIYAFSHEIARVREVVSDPMPGEVRLQWWRDALGQGPLGGTAAHPVAAALMATIARYRLPVQAFRDLVDARVFDLYDDPMPSLGDLEGYCGETSSALMRLASLVLADGADSGPADAAGHAGVAYAITGLLRAFPWHAARGQLYVPMDVLARSGVTRDDVVSGRGGPGLAAALGEMRLAARGHYEQAAALLPALPMAVRAALLPLALVPAYLARMERRDYDPFRMVVDLPQWRKQWILWRAARRFA
ncbi:phytoene/squalene synthase family protein [Chelatococcus sp. SYSU_G07232]|uniref:Phytoene/squalene synthase family protein n=1 Tax=Chelatococcus albus TaxID=3047466 RepID=A0ABT7AER5_9HYPH|nr:phytoene/squalene synthase family protein [Chelatococcus sp. SYSU_G07232]MDJ1157121.1 phytoene/squalene synthase family protein [Chelatococcus sp. SYSU_G07232]